MTHIIRKSIIDQKEYRHVRLENKLEVLIIYDKTTDISSTAMTVGTGYYWDKPDYYGTAHFLEHMLFMGTSKYPDEKLFHKFINESGGLANAHTMEEVTTYYFQILNKHYLKALDIFSQFFIHPLFSKNAVEREVNAVNSEHLKNITMDYGRVISGIKELVETNHPFKSFGCGNLATLMKPNIRDVLINFYQEHYSANLMKLVVWSNIELDQMEVQIRNLFSSIPNKNISRSIIRDLPFPYSSSSDHSVSHLVSRHLIKMVPVQDARILLMTWQVPNTLPYYESKPLQYIIYLLNHQSEGSIYHNLKQHNLCTSYTVDILEESSSCHMIAIAMELTDVGFKSIPSIVQCVYQYLEYVRQKGVTPSIYNEIKEIEQVNFDYKEITKRLDYIAELSMNMTKYKPEDILYGAYKYGPYNESLIKSILKYFVPANTIITVCSHSYQHIATKQDKWYGARYIAYKSPKDLGSEFMKNEVINWELFTPRPNPFIPHEFTLYKTSQVSQPMTPEGTLIKNIGIWIKSSSRFGVPKIFVNFTFTNYSIYSSIQNYLLLNIYFNMMREELKSDLYYAHLCSTGFAMYTYNNKFGIVFYGFNDTIGKIIQLIFSWFGKSNSSLFRNQVFEIVKYNLIDEYKNFIYKPGYVVANEYFTENIYLINYTTEELLSAIQNISIDDLTQSISSLLYNNTHFKIFIYGNVSQNVSTLVEYFIPFQTNSSQVYQTCNKIIYLNPGEQYKYIRRSLNETDDNNVILVFYEVGKVIEAKSKNWEQIVLALQFINNFVKEKFFTQVRTIEQSGYIVKSYISSYEDSEGRMLGFTFLVQSSHMYPDMLRRRVKRFVNDMEKELANMKLDEFNQQKQILSDDLDVKFTTMNEEFDFYNSKIMSETFAFESKKMLKKEVQNITPQLILNFYKTFFTQKSTRKVRVLELYKRT